VDNRSEVRDFLASRRARVTPDQVGLPTFGGQRRVPGLRRNEVAALAGVSIEYYTRLERGNLAGVSDSVLDSLARALLLDDAERAHLFDLARTAATSDRKSRHGMAPALRPSVQRVLDAMTGAPAYVRNGRMDIVAGNHLCFALYADILGPSALPMNLARFLFLDPRAVEFFVDWDSVADDAAATLRGEAGRNPLDRGLIDLVGELSTRSETFRVRWARHNVRLHRTAVKRMRNPLVGEIELTGDAMELPGTGMTVIAYTAEPASKAQQQLAFLASWSAGNRSADEPKGTIELRGAERTD